LFSDKKGKKFNIKNMKTHFFLFLIIACFLACSCNDSPKTDLTNEVTLLRQTADSLLKALSDLDAERFISFYQDNALFMSPESGLHQGKADIKNAYSGGFSLPGFKINGSIQDLKVARGGDMGYTIVPWDSYFIPEAGEKIERKGLNLLVWEKQANGSWKVIIDKP